VLNSIIIAELYQVIILIGRKAA